jgi:uncharacterized protein YbbK (DUF523 family)
MYGRRPVIVSACLLGFSCRYDGGTKPLSPEVLERLRRGHILIPVCPEQMGGLPTPRPKMEIGEGDGNDVLKGASRVLAEDGKDVSQALLRGAYQVSRYAKEHEIVLAIMKDGSPSCGVYTIRRKGKPVEGMGVTTVLLQRQGMKVISEDDL